MSAPYACFEKMVSLTDTDCACYSADFDAEDLESASGLTLTGLEFLDMDILKAAATCSKGSIKSILRRALDEGLKRYKSETLAYVQSNTKWKRVPVVGPKRPVIGEIEGSRKALPMGSAVHSMSIEFAHHVGGWAKVKRIGTYFTTTGTIDLSVYGIADDDAIDTITMDTEANKLKWTDVSDNTDLEFPLEVEGTENPRVWFAYEPGSMVALNSRLHCGCGGKSGGWRSDSESEVKRDGQAWAPWVREVGGSYGADITERRQWSIVNETQGIVLDIEFTCETSRTLCDGVPDYANDQLQMSAAYAVRYAAGAWLMSYMIASSKVNRETLTGEGPNYYAIRGEYNKGFKENAIDFVGASLVQLPDPEDPASGANRYTDCFTCRDKHGIRKGTLLR